jgi:hypothetical protein
VYQLGTVGVLPTPTDVKTAPITILPGLPTTLASGVAQDGTAGHPVMFPFGIFFASANTLYVCDEGDGGLVAPRIINGQTNVADDSELATAGLQKWARQDGTWHLAYTLRDGLDIGVPYSIRQLSRVAESCHGRLPKPDWPGKRRWHRKPLRDHFYDQHERRSRRRSE